MPRVQVAKPAETEKKKEEPKPEDRLTSILRNVEKLKEKPSTQQQPARAPVQAEPPQISAVQRQQLENSIQNQIRGCWRLDAGARQAEDLLGEVTVNPAPARSETVRVGKEWLSQFTSGWSSDH